MLPEPPTPLDFVKNYLVPHTPVIIKGLIDDWPALNHWGDENWTACNDAVVSVNVTPTGHGDRVVRSHDGKPLFVKPEERRMKFHEFQRALREPQECNGVPYLVS